MSWALSTFLINFYVLDIFRNKESGIYDKDGFKDDLAQSYIKEFVKKKRSSDFINALDIASSISDEPFK